MHKPWPNASPFGRTRGPMIRSSCRVATLATYLMIGGAVVAAAETGRAESKPPNVEGRSEARLILVQVPLVTEANPNRSEAAGAACVEPPLESRIVAFDPSVPANGVTNLTPGFAAAGQPDLSFDGQRVLFTAKRTEGEPFNVWEMNTDGTGLRQITKRSSDCYMPIHLSTIYTLDAEKPVHQIAFCSVASGEHVSSLYTCRMDGTRTRRITFNPYGASDPFLISDSRLLYSSGNAPAPAGGSASGTTLMTVNTDGTDVFIFAAACEAPVVHGMPCETPDGWIVYVESNGDGPDRGGSLVAVARTRSLHTRRLIADDSSGLYHSPSIRPTGELLVSYRAKNGGSYGLYLLDPQSGAQKAQVLDTAQWHEIDAFAVHPRFEPAGHASVVKDQVDSGKLYCMNAYLSDTEESRRFEQGRIKTLRVVRAIRDTGGGPISSPGQQEKHSASDASTVREEVLGSIAVEQDGSFLVDVPARTPLRLETLDAEGKVLQAMTSWLWVMPQEPRGCIGCHEDRELTPPNRHVYALRKEAERIVPPESNGQAPLESQNPKGDPK